MPHSVKVALQINVDDACLAMRDCRGDPDQRLMSCALRAIAKRPRLEVRLEDRLHNQLQRTLYHAITDAGNRKSSHFVAPLFRYLFLPRPQRQVGAPDQFVPDLLKETFHTLFLNGLEADSVTARSPIISF